MPDVPPNYHLLHLWIDLTRELQYIGSADVDRFGMTLPDLLIRCAVYIATVDGRPMTAWKLADYTGIPRGTVVHRLRALERAGLIEKDGDSWRTSAARLAALPDVSTAQRLVHAAHERLKG